MHHTGFIGLLFSRTEPRVCFRDLKTFQVWNHNSLMRPEEHFVLIRGSGFGATLLTSLNVL